MGEGDLEIKPEDFRIKIQPPQTTHTQKHKGNNF